MKKAILLLAFVLSVICLLPGCKNKEEDPMNLPNICGGTVDYSDHNAPKVIESDTLVSVSCSFFLYGELGSEFDSSYGIKVSRDSEGKLILQESGHEISCETDDAFLTGVQELIKKHHLVSLNGTDRHTSGLPEPFQPCYFRAVYDSGEVLSFSVDNNPESEWGRDLLALTQEEFDRHGITALDPPAGTAQITRFTLSYTEGDVRHHFGEISIPVEGVSKSIEQLATEGYLEGEYVTKIEYRPWDRLAKKAKQSYLGDPDEEYYNGLSKLVSETGIKGFANEERAPSGFDYNASEGYFEFYIEFEYGNVLYGFSDDPDLNMAFAPVAGKIADYIKTYTDTPWQP